MKNYVLPMFCFDFILGPLMYFLIKSKVNIQHSLTKDSYFASKQI